ncbi:MAG: sugar nucleotide-binding protein [Candidatus Aenigmatarchaeota archaeon]
MKEKTKILITGSSGRLGKPLMILFMSDKKYNVIALSHKDMPVEDRNKVFEIIEKNKPEIIIHLAALTSPPRCEKNKVESWRITVEGTINLVDACEIFSPQCYFVLMSTPCVFSGEDENPKDENYIYNPDNYYGFCKAIQEMVVRRSKLKWLIIRGNFVPYEKWPYPKAFVDRKSNYLFAHQLAKGIKEVIEANQTGIIHIIGNRVLSMYELAKLCPESENVQPMTLEEYYNENPDSPKLTKNMVLKSTRWKEYKIEEI